MSDDSSRTNQQAEGHHIAQADQGSTAIVGDANVVGDHSTAIKAEGEAVVATQGGVAAEQLAVGGDVHGSVDVHVGDKNVNQTVNGGSTSALVIALFALIVFALIVLVVLFLVYGLSGRAPVVETEPPTATFHSAILPNIPNGTPTITVASRPPTTTLPSPTITPTSTPDCQNVQVSCLELVLVDNSDQQTIQICPDQNEEIVITRSQIDGLGNLQGRAILTGTDVADCTCDWMGKTNGGISMQPINSQTGKCAFSIGLPDQVTVVNLMLTIGGGSGPIRLFKVRVR